MNSTGTHSRIVLFLGSGASAFAGYRTFETFPVLIFDDRIRAQEELPPLHSNTVELLREVEQTLHVSGKPTTHDNFLWALDDYKTLWRNLRKDGVLQSRFLRSTTLWGEFAYFSQTAEDATNDITLITVHHYSGNRVELAQQKGDDSLFDSMHRVYQLYVLLASRNDSETPYLPVFTTNYDMLVEDLFSAFNPSLPRSLPLVNGVPDCTTEADAWDEAQYQQYDSLPQGFHLYRIHGCVCWFYHGLGDERIYFHRRDCLQQQSSNLCAMYPGLEIRRGLNPHAFGFRQLYKMLLGCECVVFIGFSFRDDDVMHLILAANAQRETALKVIVLDPNLTATDVSANLKEASKRTAFPARVPEINEITSVDARFGFSDFDIRLMDTIDKTI